MYVVLEVPRSTFYYQPVEKLVADGLIKAICLIFKESRKNYGTQKIKNELEKKGWNVSRQQIGRSMKEEG